MTTTAASRQVVSHHIYHDAVQHMNDNLSRENSVEQSFSTPLHFATIYGDFNLAWLLIQSSVNVNRPNENQETPLSLAARHGRPAITRLLLESGSSINFQDQDGSTPLHKAAENGHLDIVTLLLHSGADFNIHNNNDKTCLNMALDHGKLDVARLLTGHVRAMGSQEGIDLTPLTTQAQDTAPGVAPPTPGHKKGPPINESRALLHDAAKAGNLDLVWSLLDSGTNVDDRDDIHRTPLYLASLCGRVEVAKLLLEYGADVNALSRYHQGKPPALTSASER
jgi:ankyrin repeat protein